MLEARRRLAGTSLFELMAEGTQGRLEKRCTVKAGPYDFDVDIELELRRLAVATSLDEDGDFAVSGASA